MTSFGAFGSYSYTITSTTAATTTVAATANCTDP